MVLYCNMLTILFTEIIHKEQTKNKGDIFHLTVEYLEKCSSPVQQLAHRGWHRVTRQEEWVQEEEVVGSGGAEGSSSIGHTSYIIAAFALGILGSVQSLSRVRFFATPWTKHCRLLCPSPTPRVYPNSRPLSGWCHPSISSSVVPFSFHLQSFPASGSFPMSQFFPSGGQSIGVSASVSDWRRKR